MTNLSLTYSAWWVFVCLLVGVGYAWIQYSKTAPWSKPLNYVLAGLRILLITLIAIFILEPYIQTITNYFQKPKIVMAIDNSESMVLDKSSSKIEKFKLSIIEIKNSFRTKGFDVNLVDLNGNQIEKLDSLKFSAPSTDLSKQLIKIKNEHSSFNLSGVVLFSDGIFNEGYSPLALIQNFPIYTVGVGDTSQIRDLAIKEVKHNSSVFEGNSLLMEIQMLNSRMGKVSSDIIVMQNGKVLLREKVSFPSNQLLVKKTISIPIEGSGKHSLSINLNPLAEEFSTLNNSQTIYFDVIEAQKQILMVAAAPHPDLKAIKGAIEKNEYYKVELVYQLPDKLEYDLIIAHQYPSVRTPSNDRNKFLESAISKWLIVGGTSDFKFLKEELKILNFKRISRKSDLVRPVLSSNFDAFQLGDDFLGWVTDLPPLSVPYGLEVDKSLQNIFLKQQIGSVVTEPPLLYFSKNKEQRIGVLLGTNSWKWRLDEYRVNQSHENFDNLISKTVQYLSANGKKKRFYVNPQKELFEKGEDILFYTEEYNALFERVTGKRVDLEISKENSEKSNYTFVPLSTNSVFKVPNLDEGVYSYTASTELDSKKYYSTGQFVIQKLNKEAINPVADFDLLRKIAEKSQGSFYPLDQMDEFENLINKLNPVSTIHTSEKDELLLNLKWALLFLVLLATSEWFLRKFYGGY